MRAAEHSRLEPDGTLVIEIQRELRSPNRNPHGHWSGKNRERRRWQASIANAIVHSFGLQRALAMLSPECGYVGARGVREKRRRRLVVIRLVPSARNFIKDDDNLMFSAKRLRDALKRLGLVFDDSRKWLDYPLPQQAVSDDGTYWTVIRLEPAAEEEATSA